jgi:hypothetical protein
MKRKKRILEKYDKKTGKWISVPFDNANEEMIRIYEMMEAELEITAKQEAMKLGLYKIKNKS